MKTKLYLILTLAAFMNPLTVLALGETKKTEDMNPVSIGCLQKAKRDWGKANPDAKIEDVIKDAKTLKSANGA